eukprot:2256172-Rhodomonas_salina.4
MFRIVSSYAASVLGDVSFYAMPVLGGASSSVRRCILLCYVITTSRILGFDPMVRRYRES